MEKRFRMDYIMNAVLLYSVLFMIIGGLVYILSSNAKIAELGRLTYWAGVFALALRLGSVAISLFK